MEKQRYIKPETNIFEMESCTILAGSPESPSVADDGESIYTNGEPGNGDAGAARVRRRDLWDE